MNYNKIIIALVVVLVVMVVAGVLFLNFGHAKVDSNVVVSSNSTLNDGDNFTIKLTDLNNTPIANQTVNVTIIDSNGGENPQVITTDANGDGSLQLNDLAVGNYTINVTYGGNENYTSCNTTQKLTIAEKVTISESNTVTSSSTKNDYDWKTSTEGFEYRREFGSDGGFREYDRSGRLVGSSYQQDQAEVTTNVMNHRYGY